MPKFPFNSSSFLLLIPMHHIIRIRIRIHLDHAKPILTLLSMKKVLEKLPEGKFKRIHRSYIVPVDKVMAIYNWKVQL